jgi:hypothetical protein
MKSTPIDIMDPSLDSNALIVVTQKGTILMVPDDVRELVLKEFPKLKTRNWKRETPPNGQAINSVRIKHEQGLEIVKALARHGLRTMGQDCTGPVITFMPFDAHLRHGRPDLH